MYVYYSVVYDTVHDARLEAWSNLGAPPYPLQLQQITSDP